MAKLEQIIIGNPVLIVNNFNTYFIVNFTYEDSSKGGLNAGVTILYSQFVFTMKN